MEINAFLKGKSSAELKDIIKRYHKEGAYSHLKKNELTAYVKNLMENGKIKCHKKHRRNQCKCTPEELEGAGIFDFFRSPKESYNNVSTRTLNQFGPNFITQIEVMRTPIFKVLDKAINFISFGKWNQLKNKYNYDSLFHLCLIATLAGNRKISIEKNANVDIHPQVSIKPNSEVLNVPLNGRNITYLN
jgi:hypothetical protein